MTAKQISDIAAYLEKLGYEIIKIKDKKEIPDFPSSPATTHITFSPVKSKAKPLLELCILCPSFGNLVLW